MHLYKKLLLIIVILIPTNLFAEYEININFESGFEFKSQQSLIKILKETNSKRQIEKVISSQDWVKNYSIKQKPFSNKIISSCVRDSYFDNILCTGLKPFL